MSFAEPTKIRTNDTIVYVLTKDNKPAHPRKNEVRVIHEPTVRSYENIRREGNDELPISNLDDHTLYEIEPA